MNFRRLDHVVKVVREGQTRRAPIERLADLLTGYFVPVITLLAIITWVIWLALGLSGSLPPSYLDIDVGGWSKSPLSLIIEQHLTCLSSRMVIGICHRRLRCSMPLWDWSRCSNSSVGRVWTCCETRHTCSGRRRSIPGSRTTGHHRIRQNGHSYGGW